MTSFAATPARIKWRIYWATVTSLLILAVLAAWSFTRPRFDAQAMGTVAASREVDTREAFGFEQTVVFAAPRRTVSFQYGSRIPYRPGQRMLISYNSANPSQFEVYDTSRFRHALQMIAVAAALTAGFAALAIRQAHWRQGPPA